MKLLSLYVEAMPLVTVAVPVYNPGSFMEQRLRGFSALALEFIVIDHHSSDDTLAEVRVLRKLRATRFNGVDIVGPMPAFDITISSNTCIARARGELLFIIASGDLVETHAIEGVGRIRARPVIAATRV